MREGEGEGEKKSEFLESVEVGAEIEQTVCHPRGTREEE